MVSPSAGSTAPISGSVEAEPDPDAGSSFLTVKIHMRDEGG